jgi:iron complex outermembrane recepter protein
VKTELLANVTGTLALFRITRDNTLVTDPIDAGFDIQTGKERSRGIESDIVWQASESLAVRLGYAFLDTEILEDTDPARRGNERPRAPSHQVSSFANYTFLNGPLRNLRLTAGVVHIDEAFASVSNEVSRPGYTLVNLGASYRYRKLRLDLNATNVFDKEFFIARNDLQVNAGEPRLITLRASVEF